MHVHFLDPYLSRESKIHMLDPRVKLVLTLAFVLTTALTPVGAWPVYILLFSLILSVEILSELGIVTVLKRAILAVPFVFAALPVVFTTSGQELVGFSIGEWPVVITAAGVERFLSIAIKSWLSLQAAIVLASSTTFPELLVAMRAVKAPRLLVAIFGLMWRYLFVMVDEVFRLTRARTARSGYSDQPDSKPGGSLTWRAKVTGGMAGSLFLRAFERSDRIYMAMISRGYDGEVRTSPLPRLGSADRLFLIISLAILAILLALAVMVWA